MATEIANDNFVVVAPRILVSVAGPSVLTTWLGISYRAVTSVDDLPDLDADGLRGGVVSLGVRLDRHP